MALVKHLLSTLIVAWATSLPAWAVEPTKIVVEGTYPPWNIQAADGSLSGFDVELAREVCKRAALDCQFTAQVWDSQIPSLLAGKFDAMMTVGPTPKRVKVMTFSTPYAATPETFMVAKAGRLTGLPSAGDKVKADDPAGKPAMDALRSALKGKTVAVVGSSSLQDFLEKNLSEGVDIRAYKSEPDMLLDLRAGRVDAVFDSSAFLRSAAKKPENNDLTLTGPLLSADTLAATVCFGFSPGNTELKAKLDRAILAAAADGTVKSLSEKWFGFDVSP